MLCLPMQPCRFNVFKTQIYNMQAFNQVIPFLSALTENNNKKWFESNHNWYQQARDEMIHIASGIVEGLRAIDPTIGSPDPKKCLFRQNRDIRFSTNKNPYKTNMGAYFAPGGKNLPYAGYYLHLEPDASFVGGGIYQPEKEQLYKVRREIYFNANELINIINGEYFRNTFGPLMDQKLKRPPQGFPADFPHIDLLKYTSYVVSQPFAAADFTPEKIILHSLEVFAIMSPLVNFLNKALGND